MGNGRFVRSQKNKFCFILLGLSGVNAPISLSISAHGRCYFCAMKLLCSLIAVVFCLGAHAQEPAGCCARKIAADKPLSCSLTTAELHARKETVLASLKAQVIGRQELDNGYAFHFPGTDAVMDELTEFIKTERTCCSFFTFTLSVQGDGSLACLELTGPPGAKEMIVSELGL
jgi:hypothetical protein